MPIECTFGGVTLLPQPPPAPPLPPALVGGPVCTPILLESWTRLDFCFNFSPKCLPPSRRYAAPQGPTATATAPRRFPPRGTVSPGWTGWPPLRTPSGRQPCLGELRSAKKCVCRHMLFKHAQLCNFILTILPLLRHFMPFTFRLDI